MAPGPIQLIDRLASSIIGALHNLFGFQYSANTEHYVYQTTITTVVAVLDGAVFNDAIRITTEADFVCTRLQCNVRIIDVDVLGDDGAIIGMSSNDSVAGDLPDAPFLLLITDGSSDRTLSNEAVDPTLAYSTYGGLPGIWARPRLFARNSTIGLTVTLLKSATADDIWVIRLAFVGWKIYDSTQLDLTSRRA